MDGVREIERAMGVDLKALQPSEEPCRQKLGKSVVASQLLAVGTVLCSHHLAVKVAEPLGWQPQHVDHLIGRVVARPVCENETLTEDCLV